MGIVEGERGEMRAHCGAEAAQDGREARTEGPPDDGWGGLADLTRRENREQSDPDEGGHAGGWLCCERAARVLGTQEEKGTSRH